MSAGNPIALLAMPHSKAVNKIRGSEKSAMISRTGLAAA